MDVLIVLIPILIVIVAIICLFLATKKGIASDNVTTMTSSSSSSGSTGEQPVRTISYTVRTTGETSRSSQSLRGTSTSTVTRTVGTRAGEGKVVSSVSELAALSAQIPVRVNGRISRQNPVLVQDFVAYLEEVFRGLDNNGNPSWAGQQSVTPPLLIEVAGETVPIINEDYGLTIKVVEHAVNGYVQGRPMYKPQEDHLVYDDINGEFSRRFCGLEREDEVVVTGTVVPTETGIAIAAQNIAMTR